ncbi:hypothetical protein HBZC1_10040 [Helicobacter bizzozeronii CIII-1]|uniref:Uncharacterized protein n=1 Tax=Helicobacter bizzozeronii (strain CIII-1) TaxID=1002804 RepID=F8KT44_HELBC|nr:hypothetical protein HBZC1_10040 [Helicobacter bizzozeronii CIII-1]
MILLFLWINIKIQTTISHILQVLVPLLQSPLSLVRGWSAM